MSLSPADQLHASGGAGGRHGPGGVRQRMGNAIAMLGGIDKHVLRRSKATSVASLNTSCSH